MQNNLLSKADHINLAPGNDLVKLKYAKLTPTLFGNQLIADVRSPLKIDIEFWNLLDNQNLNISLHIFASTGECIFNVGTLPKILYKGVVQASLTIPEYFLNDGNYLASFMVVKDKSIVLFNFEEVFNFEIADYRKKQLGMASGQAMFVPNSIFQFNKFLKNYNVTCN